MTTRPVSASLDFVLVIVSLLFQSVLSSEDNDSRRGLNGDAAEEMVIENWFALFRYLIGLGFIIFGAIQLLYGHLASYKLLKRYQNEALRGVGQVLSCDEIPGHVKKYEIQVLYSAPSHRYVNDPRNKFRYPDALLDKDYLRRFETNWLTPRGSSVELLLLKGLPRSACTEDMIDSKLQDHSHAFTAMILVPVLILVSVFLYLSIVEIQSFPQNEKERWIGGSLLVGCLLLYISVGWSISDHQFQKGARTIFMSAVPMRKKRLESQ